MKRILLFLLSLSLVLSFLNFLPRFFWWQELNQTLWLYHMILQIFFVVLIAVDKSLRRRGVWRLCFLILIASLVMYSARIKKFHRPLKATSGNAPLSVFFIDDARSRTVTPESGADIVITLCGGNPLADSPPPIEGFPYTVSTVDPRSRNFSLHSRHPFEGELRTNVGLDMPPVLISKVAPASGPVTIAAMQMLPPADSISVFINDVYIRRLGTQLRYIDGPVVVLGVMHTVPFSRSHSTFVHVSRTQNAVRGLGLPMIWDPGLILPFFPGTHFFVKGGVRMVSLTFIDGAVSGSFRY